MNGIRILHRRFSLIIPLSFLLGIAWLSPGMAATPTLWNAIAEGKPGALQVALKNGADANEVQQKTGRTPLMAALAGTIADAGKRRALVETLLKAGADPNATDKYQEPVLSYVMRLRDWPLMQTLVEAGADVNRLGAYKVPHIWSPYGNQFLPDISALMWCARGCQPPWFRFLLDAGGDATAVNVRGEDALAYALIGHREDNLREALRRLGASMDKPALAAYLDQRRHLIRAVRTGQPALVDALLASGASPDVTDDLGQTALVVALVELGGAVADDRKAWRRILEALLREGANPNAMDAHSPVPLNLAVAAADRRALRMLFERGARIQPGKVDPLLLMAEAVAVPERESVAITRLLIERGAPLNGFGWNGANLLEVAAGNTPHLVPVFLKAGLDVNHRDQLGNTPLMYAAFMGVRAEPIVPQLVAAGAEVNAQNKLGWTALMLAAEKGASKLVDMLLKAGADTRLVNQQGQTALEIARTTQYARYQDKTPTIALLEKAATIPIRLPDGSRK